MNNAEAPVVLGPNLFSLPCLEQWGNRLAWIFCSIYFVFFSFVSYFLYQNYLFDDFDLAVHSQTLWNLAHGSGFSSILGLHFIANHAILIFYPLALIYKVFSNPFLLLALQSLSLGFSGMILYRFSSQRLNQTFSVLVLVLYLIYPALGFANAFEFHPTTLAVPFLFCAILFFYDSSFAKFVVSLLIAMSCQENIALGVFVIGLVALYERRKIHWVVSPMFLAMVWFAVIVMKVQPFLNRGTIEFTSLYGYLGKNIPEIFLGLLIRPYQWIPMVFSLSSLGFVFQLLGPLCLAPAMGYEVLAPALPFFMQHVLSTRLTEKTIYYHYAAEMIPFIFAALVGGIARLHERYFKNKLSSLIFTILLVGCGLGFAILMPSHLSQLDKIENFTGNSNKKIYDRLIESIPKEASVVSTFEFLPKLANRRELYSFHHVYMGTYTLSSKPYILPDDVSYALINFNDSQIFGGGFENPKSQGFLENFMSRPWKVVQMSESTVLFKKEKSKDLSPLFVVSQKGFGANPEQLVEVSVNKEIQLAGFSMKAVKGELKNTVEFTFYWKCLAKPSKKYDTLITLVSSGDRVTNQIPRPVCYRIYPMSEWKAGDAISEHYTFVMPDHLLNREYEVRLSVIDTEARKVVPFVSDDKQLIDTYGQVRLVSLSPNT